MIVNFGSINVDHVYHVDAMPHPGQTISALGYQRHLGGKGINQSVAILRSGGTLRHVGCIGADDAWIAQQIADAGVADDHIAALDVPTGHALICVDSNGENQIVISSSANTCFDSAMIGRALSDVGGNEDWVLFQNETNLTQEMADAGRAAGCRIAYSAAPFSAEVTIPILPMIDLLVVNEQEAADLADALGCTPHDIVVPMLLITRGTDGADLHAGGTTLHQPAFEVTARDTTGAGDTYLGAFLARMDAGEDAADALRFAAAASAIQVTRDGAASAIPTQAEVAAFLKEHA